MHLNAFTDYCLRVLIYLAIQPDDVTTTRAQIAHAYGISDNHLMKVVHFLSGSGVIETTRGRGGGMRLAKLAREMRIGDLLRLCEDDHVIVECFQMDGGHCKINGLCKLKRILAEARDALYAPLNRYTLEDITLNKGNLADTLGIVTIKPASPDPR